jgi:hypothetical protein
MKPQKISSYTIYSDKETTEDPQLHYANKENHRRSTATPLQQGKPQKIHSHITLTRKSTEGPQLHYTNKENYRRSTTTLPGKGTTEDPKLHYPTKKSTENSTHHFVQILY